MRLLQLARPVVLSQSSRIYLLSSLNIEALLQHCIDRWWLKQEICSLTGSY